MMQSRRISTNIGQEQLVTVEINQDYDFLEILSLKFSQQDIYSSFCADYGVVCGRISANNGFGLPNARVSIFVPLSDADSQDPVISALYPYTDTTIKDDNNYRYNLLPARQQHSGHSATGTFPDQLDILNREEVLEVYEKYYKYTVKTNDAGDFMIWGVPLGQQTIHIDMDLSDIGCFSLRPYDFIRQGAGVDKFQNSYTFKSSQDLDSLPQIVSFEKTIEVYPFWGNEDLCSIGISRVDFDLSDRGIKIEPKAFLIGGSFTDTGKNSVNKNCTPRKRMGRKCDLRTKTGKIEAIRFTPQKELQNDGTYLPILENYDLHEDIPEDGSFVLPLPMNMDYVYTNEFGENEITNNPNKGIATSACYRFKFTLNDQGNDRARKSASYLVPNIRDYVGTAESNKSYAFSTNLNDYPTVAVSADPVKGILYSEFGEYYPKDYFFRMNYNKVYTVSSFHSGYFNTGATVFTARNDSYIGIKEIAPTEDEDCSSTVETPPVNFGVKHYTFTLLIADILLFFEHLINLIVFIFANSLIRTLQFLGDSMNFHPIKFVACKVKEIAYSLQESLQRHLYLINYPDCQECNGENQFGSQVTGGTSLTYCKVAEMGISGINSATVRNDFTTPSNTWKVIHNLGISHPNIRVFIYDPQTQSYTEWIDYDYPNSGATPSNSFYKSDISTTGFTINFTVDGSGNTLNETGYVTISSNGTGQSTITNKTYYPSPITCSSGTARAITNDADFVQNQTNYLMQFDSTIVTLDPTTDAYFIVDLNGNLGFVDNGNILTSAGQTTVYIVDKTTLSAPAITTQLESGCALYSRPYDDALVSEYYIAPNRTPVHPTNYVPGTTVEATNITNVDFSRVIPAYDVFPCTRCDNVVYKYDKTTNDKLFTLPTKWGSNTYQRITPTGMSEFSNGVFSFIPGTQTNATVYAMLREYRRRKRVGKMFCGGIVNYGFIDNWLSGVLYFFQFKANGAKVCDDVIKYVPTDGSYYYRSTIYNSNTDTYGFTSGGSRILGRPTTMVDLGPRDEFIKEICIDPTLDPECSVTRSIGSTSFKSFGDILGMAINYRLDVSENTYDINGFFTNGGFQNTSQVFDGDLLQLISINNEAGIEEFDLQHPSYLGYSYQFLEPRDPQAKPIFHQNGYYGPVPITLQLSSDGERVRGCLNEPGRLTESSQPIPFFLWDKKGTGFGGTNASTSNNQSWNYSNVQVQPLQGMTYAYKYTSSTDATTDRYLLLPITYDFSGYTLNTGNVTNTIEFNEVSLVDDHETYDKYYPGYTYLYVTSGTIAEPLAGKLYVRVGAAFGNSSIQGVSITNGWVEIDWNYNDDFIIRPSQDYYNGNEQILSTPFLYYFGLKAGSTAVNKFVKLFGDKGAFPPIQ